LLEEAIRFNFEPNCKPNFQSVMNYLFQVDLFGWCSGLFRAGNLSILDEELQASTSNPSLLGKTLFTQPSSGMLQINPFGSPATSHCDGSPITNDSQQKICFRLEAPASSMTWSANQDLDYDGTIEASLQGYSDWDKPRHAANRRHRQ